MADKNAAGKFLAVLFFLLISDNPLCLAATIYLKNGDRVSGEITKEAEGYIEIRNDALGSISVRREFIEEIIPEEAAAAGRDESPLWEREISLGYNEARGNTENARLSVSLYANKKTEEDEFTVKADNFYSSSNRKMDAQKWYGMLRYAFSFWGKKWYNFYKLEGDHDRFANINYRIIPSWGIGYWFSDTANWRAMVECAAGIEHADFRDATGAADEAVLVPRVFLEKAVFGKSRISQELTLYPSLSDLGEGRLRAETVFTNPVNDKLSLRLRLTNDFDSDPPKDTKTNDFRLISSLVYSF